MPFKTFMSVRFNTGVTVGKFSPPHLGHAHLITAAAAQVSTLYILVCHKSGQINADLRTAWLKDATPANCQYIITPDDLPEAPEPWARRALALIATPIDVAFTSEEYGAAWAACLGAEHVCIDLDRSTIPISATAIRDDTVNNFSYLVPSARAALCKRIVLAGAESSGKTTLSKALADALKTVWVPEYGRLYCDGRGLENDWDAHEFAHISTMQTQMIEAMARHAANGVVIADTDALVTRVWQNRYLPSSAAIDLQLSTDHYLVCEPVEWEQDGTRESEEYRGSMLSDTIRLIEAQNVPYTLLTGAHEERLKSAVAVVHELTRSLI